MNNNEKKNHTTETVEDVNNSDNPPATEEQNTQEKNVQTEDNEDQKTVSDHALQNRLQDLEKVVNDLNGKLLRALAESDNLRKRSKEELEKASKYAVSTLVSDLVVVAENFYLAVANMPQEEIEKSPAIKNFAEAVVMTKKELVKIFDKNNVKRIDPVGEKFDHHFHQAIANVETDDAKQDGLVAQVIQAGYTISDRLIRPALVKVFVAKN